MQVLFEIFFIFTAIILLANKSIGFPIKIPQEKQKMANLRKFCTLPIWYGKKHVYHSKICTTLRNVDFYLIKTTESPETTSINPSTSLTETMDVKKDNSEKYQESVEYKMNFNLQNQSGSFRFPIKIPQEKQKMESLKKFCTLPIWYGKKHVYHSKICTISRNVDFNSMKTTEYPITTSMNPSASPIKSLEVKMDNSEKYQEGVENKMNFNLQNQSGSFGYISKTIYLFVDQENYEKPTTKLPDLEPLTTKSTNEAYSFLRS